MKNDSKNEAWNVPRKALPVEGGVNGLFCLAAVGQIQEHLAQKKHPPSLGPPYGPRYSLNVGSRGGAILYVRGNPAEAHLYRVLI